MKYKLCLFLFLQILSTILILHYVFSLSNSDFTNPRKCSDIFGDCNGLTTNDTLTIDCSGSKYPALDSVSDVKEVYINATAVVPGGILNVTCEFDEFTGGNNQEYIFYYNGSGWYRLGHWTESGSSGQKSNKSVVFNVNFTEGVHIIRCINTGSNPLSGEEFCAPGSTDNSWYDNDDVNFTVTDYLKYVSWGLNVSDSENLTRHQAVLAYAQWNKDLDSALINHNGSGTFQNYTVSISGNWTNYTLDLSNETEFPNYGLINVSYIWANDTFGLDNITNNGRAGHNVC